MRACLRVVIPLMLAVAAPPTVAGQDPGRAVDELFARWATDSTPGAAVLIMRGGEVVHAKGYGMADLEQGVPIGPGTVFDIASVSKQFGAMAVALLEAEGLLSLDDDVRKYLPELHDFGRPITIRHLVHHTSGLRDWPGVMRMAGWDFRDVMSFEQILRVAFEQRELNFAPGSAYAYSNTGYNLLAEIVQRVSGQSFRAFTAARIFEPLGMRSSHFHDDVGMIVPRRAQSYGRSNEGYRHVPNGLTALGSSSLFSTVEDLARWAGNFATGTVGGAAVVARVHERGVLTNGDTIGYAFGHSLAGYRGLRTVTHTGSWAGYRSILQRFPDQDLVVIILANTAEMNTTQLAGRIADVYLAGALAAAPAPAPAQVSGGAPPQQGGGARWVPGADELMAYVGSYGSVELATSWTLLVRDGRLVASHFRAGEWTLQPVERDRFQSPLFGEVRFQRDAHGAVTGFTANAERVRGLRFIRGQD